LCLSSAIRPETREKGREREREREKRKTGWLARLESLVAQTLWRARRFVFLSSAASRGVRREVRRFTRRPAAGAELWSDNSANSIFVPGLVDQRHFRDSDRGQVPCVSLSIFSYSAGLLFSSSSPRFLSSHLTYAILGRILFLFIIQSLLARLLCLSPVRFWDAFGLRLIFLTRKIIVTPRRLLFL
jgi:hypothetical protein